MAYYSLIDGTWTKHTKPLKVDTENPNEGFKRKKRLDKTRIASKNFLSAKDDVDSKRKKWLEKTMSDQKAANSKRIKERNHE